MCSDPESYRRVRHQQSRVWKSKAKVAIRMEASGGKRIVLSSEGLYGGNDTIRIDVFGKTLKSLHDIALILLDPDYNLSNCNSTNT